jgi:hypothetical protein
MRLAFVGVFLLSAFFVFADSHTDKLLRELDDIIERRDSYVREKNIRIDRLKSVLKQARASERYDLYLSLYEEYKTFIYDSAFTYGRKLQDEAYQSKDPSKIASAKVKLGFILLSSGMFNEAL